MATQASSTKTGTSGKPSAPLTTPQTKALSEFVYGKPSTAAEKTVKALLSRSLIRRDEAGEIHVTNLGEQAWDQADGKVKAALVAAAEATRQGEQETPSESGKPKGKASTKGKAPARQQNDLWVHPGIVAWVLEHSEDHPGLATRIGQSTQVDKARRVMVRGLEPVEISGLRTAAVAVKDQADAEKGARSAAGALVRFIDRLPASVRAVDQAA